MSIIKRVPNRRNIIPQIYISCEGETEKIYFIHLRKFLSENGFRNIGIQISKSSQPDALSVVENARIRYYKKEFAKEFRDNFKIYCIFDRDENTSEQIHKAISLADKINAEIILSNPCFEIWFYAHFKQHITRITKGQLNTFLSKDENLGQHFKNKQNGNFNRLKNKLQNAMETSNKIYKIDKFSDNGNPHTDVFKVIKYIEEKIGEKFY